MNFIKKSLLALLLGIGLMAIAHEGHHHRIEMGHPKPEVQSAYALINERFQKDIQPIFQKKCFDCHGSQVNFPWYQKLPGVQQFIDSDIKEAKEHMEMTSGFPFQSHATPREDLEAIEDSVVKNNEMPPWSYRLMHADSALTQEEKEKVRQWVQFGLEMLKENPK